jgi:amidohydrolase
MSKSTTSGRIARKSAAGQTNGSPSNGHIPEIMVDVRRQLHRHPELGLHEYETSRYIRELLERHGLHVHRPLARTGLYVDIVGGHPGPMAAWRADIDALPIQDAKSTPYASTVSGVAHLCGHDAHTAIAVGVALIAAARRDDLHGTLRVFFQPNEEGMPSGAPLMIRDGVLEGVSAVFAGHVDPTLPTGRFGLIVGPATASADRFRVTVSAPSTGHSARPHQSTDTIWIVNQIMSSVYQLIGRRTDARNAAVVSICRIHGGEAYNVIPDVVEFGGTLRCTLHEDRARIKDLMVDVANSVARLHGATVELDFDRGAPPVVNDPELVYLAERTITELYGPDAVFEIPTPSMGAEDFAHYLEHIPGLMIRVGTADGPETSRALHDAWFDVDERALHPAAELAVAVLVRYLSGSVVA